jgi:hypothetical protein
MNLNDRTIEIIIAVLVILIAIAVAYKTFKLDKI